MQSPAGFKRLERNVRRLRLLLFQMYLRGDWSSVCPALLCNPRRSQVAPGILCISYKMVIKPQSSITTDQILTESRVCRLKDKQVAHADGQSDIWPPKILVDGHCLGSRIWR